MFHALSEVDHLGSHLSATQTEPAALKEGVHNLEEDGEEEIDVPESVEDVIHVLLTAIRDKDTIVRCAGEGRKERKRGKRRRRRSEGWMEEKEYQCLSSLFVYVVVFICLYIYKHFYDPHSLLLRSSF